MDAAAKLLLACRSTIELASEETDHGLNLALRIAVRAMLKDIGLALRSAPRDRPGVDAIYRAYLNWRADRGASRIYWTFIQVEDCILDELNAPPTDLQQHRAALAWWELELRKIGHLAT